MLTACTNRSNKVINEVADNAKYYESTPVPPYILERLGPFGPYDTSYAVPAGAVIVAPDGLDANDGSSIDKPTTLKKAINNAVTGTVIVMRGGTYHTGDYSFEKQITIQPYKDEKPIIKGSRVAKDWTESDGSWKTSWTTLFPRKRDSRDSKAPVHLWNGDRVFIDGKINLPVGSLSDLGPGKFYVDYTAQEVYIGEDPAGKLVEITAFSKVFTRTHGETADAEGPTIQGLTLLHYASLAIDIQGKDPYETIEPGAMPDSPVKTRIVNNRILFCTKQGMAIHSPESYIAYNDISMHGHSAMMTRMSHNSILEHNIISGNHLIKMGLWPAGIKIFNQSTNYVVRNNYCYNNCANAIWYDVGHREGVIVNNYFLDNTRSIKTEIGHRIYIAGNVMKKSSLWLRNVADNMVYNNTFIDCDLSLGRNNRGHRIGFKGNLSFDHAATGPGPKGYHGNEVANNVFVGNAAYYLRIYDENEYDTTFQTKILAHNLFGSGATDFARASYVHKGLGTVDTEIKYKTLSSFLEDYGE